MKIMFFLLGMVLALPCDAGMRREPFARAITSPGGHYVFTMLPGPKGATRGKAYGVCYRVMPDGSFMKQWRTDGWYSEAIDLHYDGEILSRIGTWASGDQDEGNPAESLAVAFYRKGKLIQSYRVSDLVKDHTKLEHTSAGLCWLEYKLYVSPDFLPGERLFQIITVDGVRYRFDIDTGKIVTKVTEQPDRAVTQEATQSTAP